MIVAVAMIMVMSVPVMVIMVVVMAVIMIMVVIMAMVMTVMMRVVMMVIMRARGGIGLERRFDLRHLGAARREQGLDLGIASDAQPVGEKLRRHVAVAERPGDARERGRIGDARLDQRFRGGDDLDQAAIVEHERIVGRKRGRLIEGEFDAGALVGEDEALLAGALLEIEDERVGGRRRARRTGTQDFCRERHRAASVS
jgi:hypothetical protein